MGDRSAHVAMEWVCKCADVVMESREAEKARGGSRGAMKANRWFNASTPRRRETTRVVTGEEEDGKGAEDGSFGRGGGFRERVVVLDVFLEREMSSKDDDEGVEMHVDRRRLDLDRAAEKGVLHAAERRRELRRGGG